MQIINIKNGFESGLTGGVIAIGNFDGIHKGHQQIIKQVLAKAKELKKPAGLLTFNPSPIEYFGKEKDFHLTGFAQKTDILNKMGLDFVAYAEFNENFSQIAAEDFVKDILAGKMKVSHVFTGEDFKFGNKAKGQGNSQVLAELAKKYGFGYTAVNKILGADKERYSSTKARIALSKGDLKKVEEQLGRNFQIKGKVIEGQKIASSVLGFPTANVSLDGYQIAKKGVYKCEVELEGKNYDAIANIGVKPTVNGGVAKPLLEVHIFDFPGENLYGKNISVKLKNFMREEVKFSGLEELKKQIAIDIKNAQQN